MKKPTPQWIQHLDDLPAPLLDANHWYLDTEFIRERTYHAELALVQIAAAGHVVLIDAPALPPVQTRQLGQWIAARVPVLHACSEDIDVLTHTTGTAPRLIKDTQLAAALTGNSMQPGYQSLVHDICQITLAKEATRSNWLQRPLSARQLDYAADDVHYLGTIHEHLSTRLQQLGRSAWWQEECQRLLTQCTRQVAADKLWRHVKGAGLLKKDAERANLQSLAAWRDQQARQRNLPRSFIVRDHDLIAISIRMPTNLPQLEQCTKLAPKQLRSDGEALLDLVRQSRDNPPPPALPGRLDEAGANRYRRWKKQVNQTAQALGINPAMLVRRRWLEALARHPEQIPEALSGWRHEVITKPLLEAL